MVPTWLLNFSKKEQLGSFFEKYWQAQLTNDNSLTENDKWFYCTHCESIRYYNDIYNEALRLTVNNGNGQPKLIPSANNLTQEIRIICFGDLTDETTLDNMHIWMAQLRQNLLTENRWTQVPNVRVYALLWRPETMTVGEGMAKYPKAKGFLNELRSLESLGINKQPFHKVILFQSGVIDEEQSVAFRQMELAALQMALSDTCFWDENKNDQFLNGGVASVFYESKVQREQEAYTLSNLILDRFCHSTDDPFFNSLEASEYVEKTNEDYFKAIASNVIANHLVYQHPEIPASLSRPEMFSTSQVWSLSYRHIWFDFIRQHLGGFKARLLNNISWALEDYENRYKQKIVANRLKYVNEGSKDLEKKVFGIYAKETRLEHISIPQGREVIKYFRKGIKDVAQQSSHINIDPFPIPTSLRNALKQARDDYGDKATEKVLNVLDTKLRTLPAINLAFIIRAVILGGLLGAIGRTIGSWLDFAPLLIGGLFGILPLLWAFISYFFQVNRINALKDQYVACRMDDLRKKLLLFIIEQVQQTYTDYDSFLQWIDKGKFEYLSKALSVLKPSDFTFEENRKFQPLLNYTLAIRGEDNKPGVPLKPVADISIGEEEIKLSGSFGKSPILGGSPANQITVGSEQKSLFNLMSIDGSCDCQELCKGLMDETIDVTNYQEKIVQFGGAAICCSKLLLLLDDSGSMCGKAIQDLKNVVLELQQRSEVEWIAFDHDLVSTSFEGGKIEDLKGEGGTSYVPAIKKAVEYLQNNYADKIILISDGEPSEGLDAILQAAKELNQPLNTITISNFLDGYENGTVAIMKDIAEKTGGQQVTVESAADINITTTPEIAEMLQAMEGGNLPFYELMRKVHLTACAEALYNFSNKITKDPQDEIINLLKDYGNKSGIQEWYQASSPTCRLTQTAVLDTRHHMSIIKGFKNTVFNEWLSGQDIVSDVSGYDTNVDIIASVFSYQVIQLSDVSWAGFPKDDASVIDIEALKKVMPEGYHIVNYYGNKIEKNLS